MSNNHKSIKETRNRDIIKSILSRFRLLGKSSDGNITFCVHNRLFRKSPEGEFCEHDGIPHIERFRRGDAGVYYEQMKKDLEHYRSQEPKELERIEGIEQDLQDFNNVAREFYRPYYQDYLGKEGEDFYFGPSSKRYSSAEDAGKETGVVPVKKHSEEKLINF